MSSDLYAAASSLTAYYPDRVGRTPARHWATEKLLHDLAALGMVEFFEGAGTDPTGLTGYASTKLWLQTETGVTDAAGTVRAYDGYGTASLDASWPALTFSGLRSYVGGIVGLTFVLDGGGSTLSTGVYGAADLPVPFSGTIVAWSLLADQTGSIVIDLWKDVRANYPPTIADTITASAKPTLSSAISGESSTLTGWTRTITAGDVIRPNVDSVTSITRATLQLWVRKT